MTDTAAFLQTILTTPADDGPRLVYAGWLEDHDQPERAEFIHVQCRLAAETPTCGLCKLRQTTLNYFDDKSTVKCPTHDPLRERQAVLYQRDFPTQDDWGLSPDLVRAAWHVTPYPYTQTREPVAVLRRGFVDEVWLPAATFVPLAPALFMLHPITAVRLTDRVPYRTLADKYGWDHQDDGNPFDPAVLPDPLWDMLSPPHRRRFPSPAEAHEWLSFACVLFGRKKAGLPQLININ